MIRTVSAIGRGTPKQLLEHIFFFNSWKHSSSLVVHLQGVFFFCKVGYRRYGMRIEGTGVLELCEAENGVSEKSKV
jgi:hypothetical protein